MRIVEALEEKGCRIPLTKGEAELAEKLATITRQVEILSNTNLLPLALLLRWSLYGNIFSAERIWSGTV